MKFKEILFVGYSDIYMQTAINSNMFPVGVSWSYRTEEELKTSGAKLVVNKASELIEIL